MSQRSIPGHARLDHRLGPEVIRANRSPAHARGDVERQNQRDIAARYHGIRPGHARHQVHAAIARHRLAP